jgi:hypothetical protein
MMSGYRWRKSDKIRSISLARSETAPGSFIASEEQVVSNIRSTPAQCALADGIHTPFSAF